MSKKMIVLMFCTCLFFSKCNHNPVDHSNPFHSIRLSKTTYMVYDTIQIAFNSKKDGAIAEIFLYPSNNKGAKVLDVTSTLGENLCYVKIPAFLSLKDTNIGCVSSGCKIGIVEKNKTDNKIFSDVFKIVPHRKSPFYIIYPNGGEKFKIGDTIDIMVGGTGGGLMLSIELGKLHYDISNAPFSADNSPLHKFVIPSTLVVQEVDPNTFETIEKEVPFVSNQARITVQEYSDIYANDASDAYFSIVSN